MSADDSTGGRSGARPSVGPLQRARTALLHLLYDGAFLVLGLVGLPWFAFRFACSRDFRRDLPQRLGFVPRRRGNARCVWIHGVSVGEIKAAGGIARALSERFPDLEVVYSSTTSTGRKLAEELYPDHLSFTYPLDSIWIVRRVFERIRPSWIVLIELEIWPNLLLQSGRAGVPVMVVNGRISERSWRGYRRLRSFLPEFARIAHYCVQNEAYRQRFLDLGVLPERLSVTGNVKFDNLTVRRDRLRDPELSRVFGIEANEEVFVAGSTHPGEEIAAFEAALSRRRSGHALRLIVAPRHPPRLAEVLGELRERGGQPRCLTELRRTGERPCPEETLVIDTIGELERAYSLADVVFVGGSLLPKGGHNVLEPAALGRAVVFGPETFNFKDETALLLERGGARRVADAPELAAAVCELLDAPELARRMGEAAVEAIAANRGATLRTLAAITPVLVEGPSRSQASVVSGAPKP